MPIFLDDTDYREFLFLLGEVVERFGIRCWSFCLMPNHYHFTWQPGQPNLSEAVRLLNGGYGLWWNRRHDRVGHVFQGRFKAQIVDTDEYLMTLSKYVVCNPVRAGLVAVPGDWPWSSYRATAGLVAAPSFLDVDATLRLYGEAPINELQERFKRAMVAPNDPALVDRLRSNERIVGSQKFKEQVAAILKSGREPEAA